MDNVIMKYVVLDVDGEATTIFPVPSVDGGTRHEMLAAIIASNPVVRLVDVAEFGGVWNGTGYVKP